MSRVGKKNYVAFINNLAIKRHFCPQSKQATKLTVKKGKKVSENEEHMQEENREDGTEEDNREGDDPQ